MIIKEEKQAKEFFGKYKTVDEVILATTDNCYVHFSNKENPVYFDAVTVRKIYEPGKGAVYLNGDCVIIDSTSLKCYEMISLEDFFYKKSKSDK